MSYLKYCFFILSCVVFKSTSFQLPSSITPCNRNRADLNECILKESRKFYNVFMNGVPELDIPLMDPLNLGSIVVSTGANGANIKAKNYIVTGLKNSTITNLKFDAQKKTFVVKLRGDMNMSSEFYVKGVVAALPFDTNGRIEVQGEQYDLLSKINWNLVKGVDNKLYMNVTRCVTNFDVAFARFNIRGSISKQMDDMMNMLLNHNWKLIIKELGVPSMRELDKKITVILNKFFSKIPYDELFPL